MTIPTPSTYRLMGAGMAMAVALALATACTSTHERQDSARAKLSDGIEAFNNLNMLAAFTSVQDAQAQFAAIGDDDGVFEATVYLALVYDQIGQRAKGYETLRTVPYRDVPNYHDYASQYYLRLMGFYKMAIDSDYEAAEQYTLRALDFTREKYPNELGYMYIDLANLAELNILRGNTDKARHIVDSLLHLPVPDNDRYLSQLYYCQGLLAQTDGLTDSAYQCMRRSAHMAYKHHSTDNEMLAVRALASIDSLRADMSAYTYHIHRRDSLWKEMHSTELHYKVAILAEQHKLEMVRHEAKRTSLIMVFTLLAAFIAAMGVVIALLYANRVARAKEREARAKERVAQLEKQQADQAAERERLEKELLQLKMSQQREQLDDAYKANLAMSINLAGLTDGQQQRMEPLAKVMRQMDGEFINRAEKRFPQLTRNDMRLICLIKIGMQTDEIALMLNIATDSLHKSRYRLRKKLGLQPGMTLESFIDTI